MTSWDEAFLILKKWRDEETWLWFGPIVDSESGLSAQLHDSTTLTASIESVRTKDVDPDSGNVILDRPESAEWNFTGATFEYSDERESPFPDASPGQYPCSLEVTFPDGFKLVFAEMQEGE